MNVQLQNVKAVLFDLDGTLLDSAPDLGFAANQLRVNRGMLALPLGEYRPFVGTGARGMLRIALGVTPLDPDFEALKEEFFVAYEQCMGQHSQLFEGVSNVLQVLQKHGLQWGIVTNKSQRFALPIVRNMHAFDRVGVVVCGDTTEHSKPHPMPLLVAAQSLGVDPAHCIYVGDDERDMLAAHGAGMQSVAAAYGYLGADGDVNAWSPHTVINSPLELLLRLGYIAHDPELTSIFG